jgi:hypothetical protein
MNQEYQSDIQNKKERNDIAYATNTNMIFGKSVEIIKTGAKSVSENAANYTANKNCTLSQDC